VDATSTMTVPNTDPNIGLHKPFLENAANGDDRQEGLGAFLVMRLVDQFCVDAAQPSRDAMHYQCYSTQEFVSGLHPKTETSSVLYEVTRVAKAALESEDRRMLFPPLQALAYRLEEESRFDEALDVLQTAIRLSDGRDAEEEVGVFLHLGRIYRNNNSFREARNCYERAGAMALRLRDRHSELLSRIGRGIVTRQTGNLPESEKILRDVIAESQTSKDGDAEARASQDLAGTLYFAGRISEATPYAFRAYELHDAPSDKARALSDTGAMLKALGHYSAAQNAYSVVLAHDLRPDVRARTEIECLEVSALTGDRVSFERWRCEIAKKRDDLPQDVLLEFELEMGIGYSMFDRYDRAEDHIRNAIAIAEELGMGQRLFFAERRLEEIQDQRSRSFEHSLLFNEEGECTTPVRETIERLEDLVAAARG